MQKFRGDTLFRNYKIFTEDGFYLFKDTDKIKTVFHNTDNDINYLPKTIEKINSKTNVDITWTAEEMQDLIVGNYILEVEIVTNDFTVTHQENIIINEDYIAGDLDA